MQNIIIKIGSSVFYDTRESQFYESIFNNLISDISNLKNSRKYNIAVCLSGAVSIGKDYFIKNNIKFDTHQKGFFASIGQPIMMNKVQEILNKNNQQIAQKLISKEKNQNDIDSSIKKLMKIEKIIPFINGNDVEIEDGARFSDNDNIASYISKTIDPDYVFILSSVDGVYIDKDLKLIESEINYRNFDKLHFFQKTENGTGGMESKILNATEISKFCKNVYIANGRTKNIIERILSGEKIGTKINFYDKA